MFSRHFARHEFRCRCDNNCFQSKDPTVDADLLKMLEAVREHFGKPVVITSSHRCSASNAAVGGVKHSLHLLGRAADIQVKYVDPSDVYQFLNAAYPDTAGIGRYNTFTHIDSRSERARWDMTNQ